MTTTLRERALAAGGIDNYARTRGFPSAQAMELVALAGSELQRTGRISDATVAKVAATYAPGARDQVRQVAAEVNQHAAKHGGYLAAGLLTDMVVGEGQRDAGYNMMQRVADADLSIAIEQKREANIRAEHGGKLPKVVEPKADSNSIRSNLLRHAGLDRPVDLRPGGVAANRLGDKLEWAGDVLFQANKTPTTAVDLRTTLDAAYTHHVVGAAAAEIAGAVDAAAGTAAEAEPDLFVVGGEHAA